MRKHTQNALSPVVAMLIVVPLSLGGCLIDDGIDINQAPTANAGPDQQLAYDGTPVRVRLDGSHSKDPDGKIAAYRWLSGERLPDAGPPGRAGEVDRGHTARPTVELEAGTHVFTLWVTDNHGAGEHARQRHDSRRHRSRSPNAWPTRFRSCPSLAVSCVCGMDDTCRAAVVACDQECWGLIACVGAMCPDTTDTACIVKNCVDFLGASTTATAAGKCVAPCASMCAAG